MLSFIIDNIGTIIAGALVIILIIASCASLIHTKKSGKSSCGGSCSGCPNSSACHKK